MFTLTIIIIFSLLIISGFCSAIETAFTAASAAKMHKIKSYSADAIKRSLGLLKIKDKVISTCLIVYSIFNTFATTIAAGLFISIFGDGEGEFISSLVMATLIIIFAEVIPKAIAVAKPEHIVIFASSFVRTCLMVMHPLNFALACIVRFFCFVFKINLVQNFSVLDEVKGIVQHHHAEGNVHKIERDMIDGVLDISYMTLESVMVHRSKIIAVSQDLPLDIMWQKALETNHNKIPLWKDNAENIVGVLDVKKLLVLLYKNNFIFSKINTSEVISQPWFVPGSVLVNKQLQDFKARSEKIAFVVNEYGDLRGMITLKDIIDEIVGHIHEEHLTSQIAIHQADDQYLIDGQTTIRQINRELDLCWTETDVNIIA